MIVYKIVPAPVWRASEASGAFTGSAVDVRDGFIHFSTAAQVRETAARHFADQADLVLAAFESDALGPALKWEPSRGGALFPHLQRALREADLVRAWPLARGGGRFEPPALGREAADDRPAGRAWR